MDILIDKILPNPEQPRTIFNEDEMEELAESIRIHGVINPIAVETAGDVFILIDGERRWRAAKMAGLTEIPAAVTTSKNGNGSNSRLERALVANIQRSRMNIIDEGQAFIRMREEFGMTFEEISQQIGKKSPAGYLYVRNRMDWAKMEKPIRDLVIKGKLPTNQDVIEALKMLPDSETRIDMARTFSQRRTNIRGIVQTCRWIANREKIEDQNPTPGLRFASLRSKAPANRPPQWDALRQIGKTPPWEKITVAAQETCKACVLSDIASKATCQECGVVDLLQRLMDIK